MSQLLKEVNEESLGTVFYNFCMNHNSVHKVPDLRGIFSVTCMLLFLRENTLHQSTFALPYTNYLGFISQHKISCKNIVTQIENTYLGRNLKFFPLREVAIYFSRPKSQCLAFRSMHYKSYKA